MTNPANVRSVLDVPCTHVAPNTEQCGALVGNPCMGPDLLPCPAHPERIAAARLHYGIADLPVLRMPFTFSQRAEVLAAADPKPLVYMAHPVAPSAEQTARVDRYVADPTFESYRDGRRAELVRSTIDGNLRRARRWLRWFSLHVPQWVVIAPWIAAVESVLEAGVEEREEREREMVVCREVASRCAAVVQVGGRVSSGMAEEGAAARAVVDLTWAGEEPPADAEASAMLAAQCEVGRG